MGSIKGITIEIGGNTQKLQDSLKDVNSKTKNLQGELKQVERLLKLDPKNTELLAQKQKLLNDSIANTKTKLETLKEAQKQVQIQFERGEIGEAQYNAITREVIATEQQLGRLESRLGDVNTRWDNTADSFASFGNSAQSAGKKLLPLTGAVAGVGIASAKMASDFTDSMAKVSTIADTTKVPLNTLRDEILDLSSQTGVSADEIANNVYDAISAGQDTADAVAFVAKSTKLSKAGFAEAGQSLDLLTTILNSYGLESSKAAEVSDMLIQVQNKGKVTVGELSSVMGKIIPTANSFSVGLDQVGAGYAILTSKGIKAAEATTYMNSMMNEMGKTGSKSDKALRDLTGKGFKELIESGNSVSDVLSMLDSSAKDSDLALADMFGSAEASKAALVLLGDSASNFNDMVGEMNDSTGATNEALEKLVTPGEKARIALNKLKNVAIKIGDILLPIFAILATAVSNFADKMLGMSDGARTVMVSIGLFAASIGPLLIVIGKMATGFSSVMKLANKIGPIISKLGPIMSAITGPIGLVVLAVVGLIAIITVLWNTNEEFRDKIIAIWTEIKEFGLAFYEELKAWWEENSEQIIATFSAFWDFISEIINIALDIIIGIFDVFIGLFTGDWERMGKGIEKVWTSMWAGIKTIISGAWTVLSGVFKILKENITGWFDGIVNSAYGWGKNLIAGFVDGVKSMIGAATDAVSGVVNGISDFIGFNSPSRKGEGRNIVKWGSNMISGFIDGMEQAKPALQSSARSIVPVVKNEIINKTSIDYNKIPQGNTTIYVNNPQPRPSELARQIKKSQQELGYGF